MTFTSDKAGTTDNAAECALRARIEAEYREMPGLRLTLPQASRLFDLEHGRCAEALGTLVDGGVLRTDGRTFLRAGDGRCSI